MAARLLRMWLGMLESLGGEDVCEMSLHGAHGLVYHRASLPESLKRKISEFAVIKVLTFGRLETKWR